MTAAVVGVIISLPNRFTVMDACGSHAYQPIGRWAPSFYESFTEVHVNIARVQAATDVWIAQARIASHQPLLGCLPVRRVIQVTCLTHTCSRDTFKAAAMTSSCLQERQAAVQHAQNAARERQEALQDQEASLNSEVNAKTLKQKHLTQRC